MLLVVADFAAFSSSITYGPSLLINSLKLGISFATYLIIVLCYKYKYHNLLYRKQSQTKMATLEDKILGNKLENYCSSSEDEDGYEDASDGGGAAASASSGSAAASSAAAAPAATFYSNVEKWSGQSANTGPKGVIKDWQRFKQLETERNEEKERERLQLLKKLSITAKTVAEDQQQREQDEFDAELAELLNDGTLLEFQRQRMQEMMTHCGGGQALFGKVLSLNTGDDFLTAVDKAPAHTTVVIHIYESHLPACVTMNRCLVTLAEEYGAVKFCKIFGSVAGLSKDFKMGGIPALLVYKAGGLIGNFVRVSDDLGGDDFYPSDVESFLIEHGMLPDKTHAPVIIAKKNGNDSADSSDDD